MAGGEPDPGLVRASDADRERAVEALKRECAAGRIDAAELELRSERAYRARTVAELAEVTTDLPARRSRPRVLRSRRLPGIAPFSVSLDVPASRRETMSSLRTGLIPRLQQYGYELVLETDSRIDMKLEERPVSTVLAAIFLFPVGLVFLLYKKRSQVSIALEETGAAETRVLAYGNAPLGVREAFEHMRP